MRFDIVVFTQEELAAAIHRGIQYIALCDNEFILPCKPDTHYIALGTVSAAADFSKATAVKQQITFTGFAPRFRRKSSKTIHYGEQSVPLVGTAETVLSLGSFSGTGAKGYGIELI